MSAAAERMMNATSQPPVPWRLREDLSVHPAGRRQELRWTIKDPVRLTYFQVDDAEYRFLQSLNGRSSLIELHRLLQSDFPESEFDVANLTRFLASAIQAGLLKGTVPGHSLRLMQEVRRVRSAAVTQRMLSVLTWRFRGIDPTRLLNALHAVCGRFLTPAALWAGLAVALIAVTMTVTRSERLLSEIPGIAALFTATNLPLLFAAIVIVKLLHELGHGLLCRHFGGECHELGILLVAFMPLLYCDVSDSWLQQDRRRRMAVAAGGILTELFLASVCALLWCVTRQGLVHTFLLNVMLICSVNTLLVNGNPLLKYDGYYVLSDWLNLPNLAGEAKNAAMTVFDRVVLGLPRADGIRQGWSASVMALWGTAGLLYRSVMMLTLLWVVHTMFRSLRLEFLTPLLAVLMLLSAGIPMVRGTRARLHEAASLAGGRRRMLSGLGITLAAAAALLLIPLPHSVTVPMTIMPGSAVTVFAQESGRMQAAVSYGARVEPGQLIATLDNAALEYQEIKAQGDLKVAEARLAGLAARRLVDPDVSRDLPAAEEMVRALQGKQNVIREQRSALRIVSPVSGLVLPPRNRPAGSSALEGIPPQWTGCPLDPENSGAWIEPSTPLCVIGDQSDLQAGCLVDQQEIELIGQDAEVVLTLTSLPGASLTGHVHGAARLPETVIDRELLLNRLVVSTGAAGRSVSETQFAVLVTMDRGEMPPLYATGHATISCQPMSLARRMWRFVCRTLTLEN